jgi:hypothetical protein
LLGCCKGGREGLGERRKGVRCPGVLALIRVEDDTKLTITLFDGRDAC